MSGTDEARRRHPSVRQPSGPPVVTPRPITRTVNRPLSRRTKAAIVVLALVLLNACSATPYHQELALQVIILIVILLSAGVLAAHKLFGGVWPSP